MFCSNCGEKIEDTINTKFCPHCGSELNAPNENTIASNTAVNTTQPTPNDTNEKILYQGAANMQYQGIGGMLGHNKGGQLILTNRTLFFKAHAFNAGQKEYIVPLQNIKFTQNTFHILTPTPNMIEIELQNGEIYKFVVNGKDKDKLKNLITEYAMKATNITAQSIIPQAVNTMNTAQTVNTTNTAQTINADVKPKSKKTLKIIRLILSFVIGMVLSLVTALLIESSAFIKLVLIFFSWTGFGMLAYTIILKLSNSNGISILSGIIIGAIGMWIFLSILGSWVEAVEMADTAFEGILMLSPIGLFWTFIIYIITSIADKNNNSNN